MIANSRNKLKRCDYGIELKLILCFVLDLVSQGRTALKLLIFGKNLIEPHPKFVKLDPLLPPGPSTDPDVTFSRHPAPAQEL